MAVTPSIVMEPSMSATPSPRAGAGRGARGRHAARVGSAVLVLSMLGACGGGGGTPRPSPAAGLRRGARAVSATVLDALAVPGPAAAAAESSVMVMGCVTSTGRVGRYVHRHTVLAPGSFTGAAMAGLGAALDVAVRERSGSDESRTTQLSVTRRDAGGPVVFDVTVTAAADEQMLEVQSVCRAVQG